MQPLDIRVYEEPSQREARFFIKLGLVSSAETKNAGKFYTFDNMIAEGGLNQYATLDFKESMVYDFSSGSCGFSFTKLREMQNLDWAEDSIMRGL